MAKKKNVKLSEDEKVIAKNLGAKVEETKEAPRPKPDRKKVRAMREAISSGAVIPSAKEGEAPRVPGKEIAQKKEELRYQAALRKGAIHSDTASELVPGGIVSEPQFVPNEEVRPGLAKRAREAGAKKEAAAKAETTAQTIASSREEAAKLASTPKGNATPAVDVDDKVKKEAAKRVSSAPSQSSDLTTQLAEAAMSNPVIVKDPRSLQGEVVDNSTINVTRPTSTAKPVSSKEAKTVGKAERIAGKAPTFSQETPGSLSAAAKLRAIKGGEAPTVYQTSDLAPQDIVSRFVEKRAGKIAAATGKNIEDVGISGDEMYTDASGKQTSVNAEALNRAQLDHAKAVRTGRPVNGIKPTDKRPETHADIAMTPHQGMAYISRHLPLTMDEISKAPGVGRANLGVKTDAFMELAKDKDLSSRHIDITNEVSPEKHKGYIDRTTGKKVAFQFHPKTGAVLNAPSGFTRTARPISAIESADVDSQSIESLMGASQVPTGADNSAISSGTEKTRPGVKTATAGDRYSKHVPDLVTSHEGYVPNSEGFYEWQEHPIAKENRVHIADITAGKILGHNENVAQTKKDTKPNSGAGMVAKALRSAARPKVDKTVHPLGADATRTYDASFEDGGVKATSRNPYPPRSAGTALVKNQGISPTDAEIGEAIASKNIKPSQAEGLSAGWAQRQALEAGRKNVFGPKGKAPKLSASEAAYEAAPNPDKSDIDAALKNKNIKTQEAIGLRSTVEDFSPKEKRRNRLNKAEDFAALNTSIKEKTEKKKNAPKPAGAYDKYTDVAPVHVEEDKRPLSAAYTKAAAEVMGERHTVPYENKENLLEATQGQPGGGIGIFVRKPHPEAGKTKSLMVDKRGPVSENEVLDRVVKKEREAQAIPNVRDTWAAVSRGHITPQDAKEQQTLDQFSEYRPVNPATGAPRPTDRPLSDRKELKYARTYEPVTTTAKPKEERPAFRGRTLEASEVNAQTEADRNFGITDTHNRLGKPVPLVSAPKPTKKGPTPVPEDMRSYYGEYESTEKMSNKGPRYNKAAEGSGQQFSNTAVPDTIVKHRTAVGDLVNHAEHGMGRVIGHIPQGQAIPGTGEKSKNGRIKKGTETVATVPHITVSFGSVGIKHVPAVENLSEKTRAASAQVNPVATPGFGGTPKDRSRLASRAGRSAAPAKPTLEVLESPEK